MLGRWEGDCSVRVAMNHGIMLPLYRNNCRLRYAGHRRGSSRMLTGAIRLVTLD